MVAVGLTAGCAATAKPAPPPAQVAVLDLTAERGQALAGQKCAACHAIGATGASPANAAPPFRVLAQGLSGPALEDRLLLISDLGHQEMWPAKLDPSEVRDLAAYIDTLD